MSRTRRDAAAEKRWAAKHNRWRRDQERRHGPIPTSREVWASLLAPFDRAVEGRAAGWVGAFAVALGAERGAAYRESLDMRFLQVGSSMGLDGEAVREVTAKWRTYAEGYGHGDHQSYDVILKALDARGAGSQWEPPIPKRRAQ